MLTENYHLTCMMCGTDVGQLLGGKFVPHANRALATHTGRRLRCGRCGGSLYTEPMDAYASAIDPLVQAARTEAEALKQARPGPLSASA